MKFGGTPLACLARPCSSGVEDKLLEQYVAARMQEELVGEKAVCENVSGSSGEWSPGA